MKNYLFQLIFMLMFGLSYGQNLYNDTTSPDSMADGVYYQAGPGSNNGSYNWTYPYGTKLSIKGGSINRTFEMMTSGYPFGDLKLRQWNSTTNNWTSWRDILLRDENGNVGIGTTNPVGSLHVFNDSNQNGLFIENSSSSMTNYGLTVNNTSTTNGYLLRLRSSGVDRVTVTGIGHVGVGTTSPDEKLHVEGNSLFDIYNNGNEGGIFFREGFTSSSKYNLSILAYDHSDSGSSPDGLSLNAYDGISFSTGSNSRNERMRILLNGNVGIGTTDTQGFKLGVNGKIAATEVKVATYANWPDYVFNKDYNLPTLKEVEQHIKDKGHLKNIPSAETVKKEGFFLGDMDSKLLQKIEELTLYTIEQEKKIETQNDEVGILKKKIKKLEKENEALQSLSKRLAKVEKLLNEIKS